jgi:TRAP-type transport system small permease protein
MSGGIGADAQVAAQEVAHAGDLRGYEWILGGIACILMLLIVGLTFVEVFTRYIFAMPIKGASEIIQFAMALVIFAGLPLITARRGHVTVSLIEHAVKGFMKWLVETVVDMCSLAAIVTIAWRLWIHADSLVESKEATVVLGLPTGPLVYAMSFLAGITVLVQLTLLMQRLGIGKQK